jgi:glycine/D-amino acid oxidase-like deaminating enzyme/CRP-like cAMP-binding protein
MDRRAVRNANRRSQMALIRSFLRGDTGSVIDAKASRTIAGLALALGDRNGRADAVLSRLLRSIEQRRRFTRGGTAILHDAFARLGIATTKPIGLPLDDRPFWHRTPQPFAGFQSHPQLPHSVDVLVIGAGLTGASAAYHLAEAVKSKGLRVALIDKGDPAGEASGRNGGNFELIPENSVGIYEGLARERVAFLRRRYPKVPIQVLRAEGERQASTVLGLALRNRNRLQDIIRSEEIDCDFSPRGWLYLAHTENEEQAICDEVTLAALHGQRVEVWSRSRILNEFSIGTQYLGRFIPGDGTYHPFKYVCGMIRAAIGAGVELYTRTRVLEITSLGPESHRVVTDRGPIEARTIVVATNAFTPQILPELSAIRAHQSQIMVTEQAPDLARGRIVTSDEGPVFFNQPREGASKGYAPLLMGGGADRPTKHPDARRRSTEIHRRLIRMRDKYYPSLRGRPPSTEWVGSMGFTPDQLPAIGFLRPGVIVAAAFNGYGGSYTTAAGQAAASMALTNEVPDWVPEDVFSPRRFLHEEPLFLTAHDSLWRIAASLCRQLKSINRQLSDAFSQSGGVRRRKKTAAEDWNMVANPPAGSALTIAPDELRTFKPFGSFSTSELAHLVPLMRRWDVPRGTVLFHEGSPGGSCFIVLGGIVEVSTRVRGQQQLLAQLPAGSIFGQVSLIDGEARSATCSIGEDAVLAELSREQCEQLFATRSETALKFLGALNQGLIEALRGADRQLMRLNLEGRVRWTRDQRMRATPTMRRTETAAV